MGEYIYFDKNRQEETSLLMAAQTTHSSTNFAVVSVCKESDEQIKSKNIHINHNVKYTFFSIHRFALVVF